MIKIIELTEEQLRIRESGDADWMPMTPEQHELFRTRGRDEHCAIVGDKFVRMPDAEFTEMLRSAFHAACHAGYSLLGLTSDDQVKDIAMKDYEFGDSFFTVTVMATDGRSATASGPLVLPINAN